MPITVQSPPKYTRESKYKYSDADLKATRDALDKGQFPGMGGFPTEGTARSAGQALANLLDDDNVGIRVFEGSNKWHFALKSGKKKYTPRKPKG